MIDNIAQLKQFLPYTFAQFRHKQCQQSAAALTYMTLFAIVPLMTVTYSMFSVIPAFQGLGEQLQTFIFSHFVPDTGQEVQQYLSEFSAQARELSAAGVGMLLVTAYLMLKNIERSFNTIWGVSEGRKGMSGFLLYWAVLSLGPLLLGVGLAMSTYLLSLKFLVSEFDSLGVIPVVLQFFPWVLTAVAFTLLFAAVPNCSVPIKDAFVGGVVTAIFFELFKDLFGFIIAQTSFSAIYGAFAFAPLFLLWIYILWMFVLGGAVLVRSLSSYQGEARAQVYPDLVAALLILWQFRQQQLGAEAESHQSLSTLELSTEQRQRLFDRLLQHKILAATQQGEYVLCGDLHRITLVELARLIGVHPQLPEEAASWVSHAWLPMLCQRLKDLDILADNTLAVPISDLFEVRDKGELAAVSDIAAIDKDAGDSGTHSANHPTPDMQGGG